MRRIDLFVVVTAIFIATSCGGGGCGGCGMQPIPGGFPSAKRNPNAAQLRVAQSGLAAIEANPGAIIGSIAGGGSGGLTFNVPASCGGSTPICCPGGNPQDPCGPIDIDLTAHPGDTPRLVLAPKQGASELDVTVRARIKTESDIPVTVPVVGDCGVAVDTNPGPTPDVQIDLPVQFVQDPTAGTTRVNVGAVNLTNLTSDDVNLTGSFACQLANLGLGFFLGTLTSTLTSQIQSTIQDQTCKKCPSGTVDECGPFATSCDNGVCQEGNACLQELGLDGRMPASSLFASLSPGTTGALDLYEVAGGYATTDNNGMALGLLGGMEPGGTPRDQCGPPSSEPAAPSIAQSAFFQGNTRPDTNDPFDVAIGVHSSQLDQFAYGGYNGGLLCLTVNHNTVSQLSTDTIGLLSRSLTHLVENNSPVAVGLRPQSPPVITLGKNTFVDDGSGGKTVGDPLLDIKFTQMEIDFFAAVDDHYIRIFTVVSDVHLPIGLQVGADGSLTPVIGNVADAFTNLTVKNSDAVTESPDDLAALFPQLLGLVIPQLSGGLGSIKVPSIGGLDLSITDITAVPTNPGGNTNDFLAIFANLVVPQTFTAVKTRADIIDVHEPSAEVMRSPKLWKTTHAPSVTLALGGDGTDLEWQIRTDGGLWAPWGRNPSPTISPTTFFLPGVHRIEVRARHIGQPDSVDPDPVVLEVPFGDGPEARAKKGADFHGAGNGAGCACDSGSGAPGLFVAFIVLLLLVPRRYFRRMSKMVALVALAVLPGCSCDHPCGDKDCVAGDIPHGALGRWTSIAGDDQRVMVATYDNGLGDLVVADVTDASNIKLTAADGIPSDVAPTHDPGSYRGGVDGNGPDVGAWTSIVLSNHIARVAYQDRDANVLKYAYEYSNKYASYVVDAGSGEAVGQYASMVVDASGHPAIAYLGIGVDDGMGHRVTELRVAHANSTDPAGEGEWTISTIASKPGTCAGLCGGGETCVVATATDPETCIAGTADCAGACSTTQVCNMGACVDAVPDPTLDVPPLGTGLYVSLVALSDGRLAATYYDQSQRALVLGLENGPNTGMFTETVLDSGASKDVGMWTSAAVASDGTIHVAYQDALGDEQLYTTFANGAVGPIEVVDDGTRTGDRPHNVGASASLYLVNDAPFIAYQDGLTADVYLASRSGAGWSTMPLTSGPILDGFWIAATAAHGTPVIAWESLTPANDPPGDLAVQSP